MGLFQVTNQDSLGDTTINGTITANQGGTWSVGRTWTLASGTDTVAAAQSGTWSVTANIGTTGGIALDATVAALQVAQGSSTSGQKGYLELAAVTTSAPSYTTGQSSPLSLTLAGGLRVDGSATTQPVSGTVTANAGTGSFTVAQATGTNLHVVVDSGSITTTPMVSSTGTISSVAGSATSVSLLATNASRKGFSLFNDSTAIAYVAFAATATTGAFSIKMQPNSYVENNILYQGAISAIWASAAGNMRITEFT